MKSQSHPAPSLRRSHGGHHQTTFPLLRRSREMQQREHLANADPEEAGAAASSPHVLKVHYKYTVALQVEPGLSYTELLDLVCKKLELQPEHAQLRYKPAESQAPVALSVGNLEAAWSQGKDNSDPLV
ncbi:neutrophil cytosol factor 2-like [Tyto alba]|uniref:neutrophil cytosol factor 2-like n=1 Tax=Tyto alba TaxID=56313 RepID=UPI001C66D59F|nr:neutrophil cytosol factor 2-like [Tyto alba]